MIEDINSHNKKAIIKFVDFKKDFDSHCKGSMLKILKAWDIPRRLQILINELYELTRAEVIANCFKVKSNLIQGDILAPNFFLTVTDYMTHSTYKVNKGILNFDHIVGE